MGSTSSSVQVAKQSPGQSREIKCHGYNVRDLVRAQTSICLIAPSSRLLLSAHKSRRGGVQQHRPNGTVKLRPWMAEPLVVKDGDASLRLVTDLPRFNWLELKYNQNGGGNSSSSSSGAKRPVAQPPQPTAQPLKVRILAMTSSSNSDESVNKLKDAVAGSNQPAAAEEPQPVEAALPEVASRWPLKKRLLRQDSLTPTTTPPSPVSPSEHHLQPLISDSTTSAKYVSS